jgi:hypothetical protein
MSQWRIFAEFLILVYSTIGMFPKRAAKLLKMLAIVTWISLAYISWIMSEPEGGDIKHAKFF